jgi:sigma-B regulation protein RsbU (phosphoserine phosphatase)
VAQPTLHQLKVYTEEIPQVVRPEIEGVASLPAILDAFARATGWSLIFVPGATPSQPADLTWSAPVNPGVGVPLGHLRLQPADSSGQGATARMDREAASRLASAVADMLGELLRTQRAVWFREAELAAGVPVVSHPKERRHLAERLQAVLQGGAQAVGVPAAAVYLLDEATTQLKLRAVWGLPLARLTEPARPLKGALADLEALLGHAVVLEDTSLMQHWKVPEASFSAAVCVPISTSTSILGTLWMFADTKRDFTPQQTNIIEVVAGRVASDLEREMLLQEGIEGTQRKRQLTAAQRWQKNQLPTIPPLLDGWDVSGWTDQAQTVGGDFFDWFCLDDGRLAVAVGHAWKEGVEAALSASAVKTALRCHGHYRREPDKLLHQVNLTVWTGSAGDQSATLFYGLIDTVAGRVRYAAAGNPAVVLLKPDGWESLTMASPSLGESPETNYRQRQRCIHPGEALLIFTPGVSDALDAQGRPLGEAGLAEPLAKKLALSAGQLAALARDRLEAHQDSAHRSDRTVVVVKRTAS